MTAKYQKPKIMLIDMPENCSEAIENAGYNVTRGSFGTPYRVGPSGDLCEVVFDSCKLPNIQEQEIIFVNFSRPTPQTRPGISTPKGVDRVFQRCSSGIIDPGAALASSFDASPLEKIVEHGGIVVAFMVGNREQNYVKGTMTLFGEIQQSNAWSASRIDFLPISPAIHPCSGEEFEVKDKASSLGPILQQGLSDGAYYSCAIEPYSHPGWQWFSLIRNKYDDIVGGMAFRKKVGGGTVLLLPQMPNAHRMVVPLIEEVFADWNPSLFPDLAEAAWIHREEYEIPRITQLRGEIEKTKQEAEQRVNGLQNEIDAIQEANKGWYLLLNGTGDELVQAVIRTLRSLGFEEVIDVDKEAKEAGEAKDLREDIQIWDESDKKEPVLVIDVKGVAGHPADDEATQAEKHALARIDEFDRKPKPLTIINHQRNLPPHDRDKTAYRELIIENAKKTRLGLMTTWDLFCLLRNKERLKWLNEDIKPIFYRSGRIAPVPDHYLLVGRVERTWSDAFGFVASVPIKAGCTLAVETKDTFEEIAADSLEVDGQRVGTAEAGSQCGVAFENASKQFRVGMQVFLLEDR